MNKTYKEVIQQGLGEYLMNYMLDNPPDYEKIAENNSTQIVKEIQELFLKQTLDSDDFLIVDEIISILNKHGLTTGGCHDL